MRDYLAGQHRLLAWMGLVFAGFALSQAQGAAPPAGGAVVIDPQTFSVDENVTADIGTVTASKRNKNETLTYAIVDDTSGGSFALDPVTAVLRVVRALDHETAASHVVTVSATDSKGNTGTGVVTVSVLDVNESPAIDGTPLAMDEKLPAGALVGTVAATDPDRASPYGDLAFSLNGGAGVPFALESGTGELRTTEPLDAATTPGYVLSVTVTDGGGLVDSADIAVSVNDVNEAPTLADATFSIDENQLAGALAGQLVAADPDPTSPNNALSYAITAGNEDGAFRIDPTGALETTRPLDFETTAAYAMQVRVQDGGGLSASAVVTVSVVDGPEPQGPKPPMFIPDIDGTNGAAIAGTVALDMMGAMLGRLGDVNGDGYFDYSIGSPYAQLNGVADIGRCNFLFGRPGPLPATLPLDDALFDGAFGTIITGDDFALRRLRYCGGLGDIDGDGVDDFIINEHMHNIYLFYGRQGPWDPISIEQLYLMNEPDGSVGTLFRPGSVSTGFLHTGAGPIGDFDADGLNDFGFVFQGIFTSQSYDTKEAVLYGVEGGFPGSIHQVDLFDNLGPLEGLWIDGNDPALDRISGPIVAGDFNGDGFDDIMFAGMWGDPNGVTNAGHVYVVFGRGGRTTTDISLPDLGGIDGVLIEGVIEGEQIGLGGVASVGDVNGDGYGDVAIGAYRSDAVFPDGGRVYVVFGRQDFPSGSISLSELNGLNGFAIDPSGHVDYLGFAVDAAGDVNGDGYDDILVGAPYGYDPVTGGLGQAYVIYGAPTGMFPPALRVADLDGSNGFAFTGLPEFQHFLGGAVRGVGDTDGDGFDDLLVSDYVADPGGLEDAGETYLIRGGDFTGSVTNRAGAGGALVAGTNLDDVLIGGPGDDILVGGLGNDVLKGAAGSDVLAIADLALRLLDGGTGFDTLRLDAGGLTLDLTGLSKYRARSIEAIDLGAAGSNSVVLDSVASGNLSDAAGELRILGGPGDLAVIGTGWTLIGPVDEGSLRFVLYRRGATRLLVQDTVETRETF